MVICKIVAAAEKLWKSGVGLRGDKESSENVLKLGRRYVELSVNRKL